MKTENKSLHVAILTCRQSAQRINYYNALGKLCKLTIITERKTPDDIFRDYNVKPQTYDVIYLKGIPMFGYMALCPGIIKYLRKDMFDIIIVEQYATPTSVIAINYMHKRGIPFVINADSGFPNSNENWIKHGFKKSLIEKGSLWITGGRNGADYLKYYGADANETKVFKFSPYSENDQPTNMTSEEEKKAARAKYGINEKYIIMTVGQQIHRKGFDVLIRSVRDIGEDVGTYILGGEPNDECKDALSEAPDTHVFFPGKVSKDTLKDYYKAADIFVFPTRYDVWGYPINEAMSFGLPIVTTKQCNAGLELIEDHKNGYLIEADDIEDLRKCIIELLQDDKLREDIGKNNYVKSKEYNSESMAHSVFSIIEEFYLEKKSKVI